MFYTNWDQVYPMFYTNWDQVYPVFYTTASQSYKALFNNVSAVTCCPYLSPSLSFLFSSSFPFSFSLLSFLSTFTLPPATHVCSALSPFSLSLSLLSHLHLPVVAALQPPRVVGVETELAADWLAG